ncbi:hypothetical protein ACJ2A9_17520 [Anaerobacillus sp. MEB173]|uniref:hypothetical protein n=1 Tax=Anaerobacillus sp. MEB173 TaxID=3383345 RepID=UPI003F934001
MEIIHNQKMIKEYRITNVSKGFPPTESTFNFKDHIVEIEEAIKDEDSYIDPWSNKIGISDLSIKIRWRGNRYIKRLSNKGGGRRFK